MIVIALLEHHQGQVTQASLSTLTAAAQLSDEVWAMLVGTDAAKAAESVRALAPVTKVLCAESSAFDHGLAEPIAALVLSQCADHISGVCAPASTWGKNILPRVAALKDVMQVSDITAIIDRDTFVRPLYAGNAIATLKSQDGFKVITVRGTSFDPCTETTDLAPIENITVTLNERCATFISAAIPDQVRPELTEAKIIVSGGRGLGAKASFALIEKLADKLGAAVGASRAAVDAGFVPNDYQVGQTGKVVAPKLYIAVGISGAIQHVAGIKDAKVIVAINQDGQAPIFEIADYGLEADLFKVIPELIEKL
jgi:electron transfer flavoprotein alpha subunit